MFCDVNLIFSHHFVINTWTMSSRKSVPTFTFHRYCARYLALYQWQRVLCKYHLQKRASFCGWDIQEGYFVLWRRRNWIHFVAVGGIRPVLQWVRLCCESCSLLAISSWHIRSNIVDQHCDCSSTCSGTGNNNSNCNGGGIGNSDSNGDGHGDGDGDGDSDSDSNSNINSNIKRNHKGNSDSVVVVVVVYKVVIVSYRKWLPRLVRTVFTACYHFQLMFVPNYRWWWTWTITHLVACLEMSWKPCVHMVTVMAMGAR